MKKYTIVAIDDSYDDMHSTLTLDNGRGDRRVEHLFTKCYFCVGGKICQYYDINGLPLAKTFKACKKGGRTRMFAEFGQIPVSDYRIKHFFDNVPGIRNGSLDSIRLKFDIARVLMGRGIMPSLSAVNNLRMLIYKPPFIR